MTDELLLAVEEDVDPNEKPLLDDALNAGALPNENAGVIAGFSASLSVAFLAPNEKPLLKAGFAGLSLGLVAVAPNEKPLLDAAGLSLSVFFAEEPNEKPLLVVDTGLSLSVFFAAAPNEKPLLDTAAAGLDAALSLSLLAPNENAGVAAAGFALSSDFFAAEPNEKPLGAADVFFGALLSLLLLLASPNEKPLLVLEVAAGFVVALLAESFVAPNEKPLVVFAGVGAGVLPPYEKLVEPFALSAGVVAAGAGAAEAVRALF